MSLRNFVNSWESGGVFGQKVLETKAVEGNVLSAASLNNIISPNAENNLFPYFGQINTEGVGFHHEPRVANNIKKDYIRKDFSKDDFVYVREKTKNNWLKVERVTNGIVEEGYVDWRYVNPITFEEIGYTEIGSSDRQAGFDPHTGQTANDLIYGDMTTQQLKDLGLEESVVLSNYTLFLRLRRMSTLFFSSGELKTNILQMIDKFERSEGGFYNSPILNNAVVYHENTKTFLRTIEERFHQKISLYKGNPIPIFDDNLEIGDGDRPDYHLNSDIYRGGLTIAVNDTWAFNIVLTNYKQVFNRYDATVRVVIYDHFGLDVPDVTHPTYGYLAGFRAWFVLQHHDQRAYQPFITEMEITHTFTKYL